MLHTYVAKRWHQILPVRLIDLCYHTGDMELQQETLPPPAYENWMRWRFKMALEAVRGYKEAPLVEFEWASLSSTQLKEDNEV